MDLRISDRRTQRDISGNSAAAPGVSGNLPHAVNPKWRPKLAATVE